jgi:hypothetical protein
LFNPNLKEHGPDKLVYATPLAFRIVFFAIALVIFVSVVSASDGPFFSRFNGLSTFIILTCLVAALYLERWIFDKQANMFERNVGIYFLFSRKKIPLDRLEKVILRELGVKRGDQQTEKIGLLSRVTRRTAMIAIEDKDGELYKLDIVKGGTVRVARAYVQKLSAFCDIPFEDNLGDLSGRTLQ